MNAQVTTPKTTAITTIPDYDTKFKIGVAFFRQGFKANNGVLGFRSYFDHYQSEVEALEFGKDPHEYQTKSLATKTHEDVITVVEELRRCTTVKRKDVRAILRARLPGDDEIGLNRAIDIALRWWLMINVREKDFKDLYPGRPGMQWDDESTLGDFVRDIFPVMKWALSPKESRLDPFFTAANMVKIGNLQIRWTPYLDDHLRLSRGEQTILWIFPFKLSLNTFLAENTAASAADSALIPRKVLEETLKSLDLLFPTWDKATKKFLDGQNQTFHAVQPYTSSRPLNLQEFDHWRDRLLEVYQEVYLAPPISISQLWNDRRNPQQWWTFWIALFICGLTMISTAASIMQAVKS